MDTRRLDLEVLTEMASLNSADINPLLHEVIQDAKSKEFSKMEKLERLLNQSNEEEQFLLSALQIITND